MGIFPHRGTSGTLVAAAGLVLASVTLVGCSSSQESSSPTSAPPSPSAPSAPLSLTAACQELATTLTPMFDSQIRTMSPAQQAQTYETARTQLQAAVASMPEKVRSDVDSIIAAIPLMVSANTLEPASEPAVGAPGSASDQAFEKLIAPAKAVEGTCKTVNVTIG